MKRNIFYVLLILPLLTLLGGCNNEEEIVFDHELPQFELKENAILLEVIMPQGTKAADDIYIVGDFNGGEEEAMGQLEWRLEKAPNSDMKWGIYLIPSTFKNGKTLADGFYFVSKQQGVERTVKNEDSVHTLDAGVGTRTNVWVNRWKSYFDTGEEKHDGYVIYVEDLTTTWGGLALYAWGDAELGGGWPGIQVTGTKTIGKATYKYFDTGKDFEGLSIHLIFNNNNGGKQFEGDDLAVTLDRDYYFRITDTGYEQVEPSTYMGYVIYVNDATTWGITNVYGWANDAPVTAAWPGVAVGGTRTFNKVPYKFIEIGEDLSGKFMNLIFNGNGSQTSDVPITLDRDFYFRITNSGFEEVDPSVSTPEEPVDPEEPQAAYTVYVEDNSGFADLKIYAYGDAEICGGWPGAAPTGTKEVGGKNFKYFAFDAAKTGKSVNLIFNDNGNSETQFNGPYITLNKDYYFTIAAGTCTEITAPSAN